MNKNVISVLLLLTVTYGYPQNTTKLQLMGGDIANIENYPYFVGIRYNTDYICGGNLITLGIVLTVAHRVAYFVNYENVIVQAGTSILNIYQESRSISNIKIHEHFDKTTMDYDIAIIKLKKPFIYSSNIQKIELVEKNAVTPIYSKAHICGFGKTTENGVLSTKLRQLFIPIVSDEVCRQTFQTFYTTRNLCVGFLFERYKICEGDAGDPLVVNGKLAGIALFSSKCNQDKGGASVFLKIAAYRDWIDNYIGVTTNELF